MSRAYISISSQQVPATSNAHLYGELARQLPFAVEPSQRSAWEFQLEHLRALAVELPNAHFFYELLIPRMGRRADLVILNAGIVFVIEYKIGNRQFDRSALDQAYGYGLDLKHFHETSHHRRIVPVLVATESNRAFEGTVQWDEDQLARPIAVGPRALAELVSSITKEFVEPHLEAEVWLAGRYRPTPTIIEAAQALYSSHSVEEISRSEAGAENLTRTADYVSKVIESSKVQGWKSICFITGVPGSGKTLAGLNLATARQRAHSEEHAVFLSGNGPLVVVLREALALDAVQRASERDQRTSKTDELRRTSAFIQNIHHFRDEALNTVEAPVERVAIFDEAQRAWDLTQTSKFMRQKRGKSDFSMSEPHFLLSVMDRHSDWCTIVCLVGGGQEINTGEAGIEEWLGAIDAHFRHWNVHLSDRLIQVDASTLPNATTSDSLHLATSIRSFRAEKLSDFVSELLDGSAERARQLLASLSDFPLTMTRDLNVARAWLKKKASRL